MTHPLNRILVHILATAALAAALALALISPMAAQDSENALDDLTYDETASSWAKSASTKPETLSSPQPTTLRAK